MRYWSFLAVCGLGWISAIACGGSDTNSSSGAQTPCQKVCSCVGTPDCMNTCNGIASQPNPEQACESAPEFAGCTGACKSFTAVPQGSGGSSGGDGCTPSSDPNPVACTAQGLPKKFKCTSATAQGNFVAAGCAKENPSVQDNLNVCCSGSVGVGGASGTGAVTGAGGRVDGAGGIGIGGFVEGPGGYVGLGGYIGYGGVVGYGGYIGNGGVTGGGGRVTCDTGWLNDCTSAIDCSCGFSCVQSCSACTPSCGRPCETDADCIGSAVGTYKTEKCFTFEAGYLGWCGGA